MSLEDKGKPTFVLYTGTESPEEKRNYKKIYLMVIGIQCHQV